LLLYANRKNSKYTTTNREHYTGIYVNQKDKTDDTTRWVCKYWLRTRKRM